MTTIKIGDKVTIDTSEYETLGINKGTSGIIKSVSRDIAGGSLYDIDVGFGHKGKDSPIIHVKAYTVIKTENVEDPLLKVIINISETLDIMNKRLDNIEKIVGICEDDNR